MLTAYDRAGNKLGDFVGHEGDVYAVAPSPDGRFLVSGSADQTVRLWNLKTRELLVTLFRGADGEWVIWTPQGFYTSSPAGARLIGWQINHGPEHEAEYVAAAQLRQHLNRPDIVARAIQLASAEEAVRQAHGADFKLADLLAKPVPRLRILSPEAGAALKNGRAQVKIELEPTPDPVKLIRIQVNGRQIAEAQPEGTPGFAPGERTFEVPLAKGENKIAIAAVNDTGETVASLSLTHEGEGDLDKRGTLYILAIGVDAYKGLGNNCGEDGKQSCDLNFAGADAKAFAEAMEKRAGPLHERVVKRVLVNGAAADDAPTAANVQDALGLLRRTGRNDTAMMFVSGHGVNDGPNYRFVPTDAAFGAGGFLRPASVVPWYAFQEALVGAKGRRILFLDTCHSGNAFNQKLLGDSYEVQYRGLFLGALGSARAGRQRAWRRARAVHLCAGGGPRRRGGRGQERAGGHRAVERLFAEARAGAGQALPARAEPASLQGPRRGGVHPRGAQVSRQDSSPTLAERFRYRHREFRTGRRGRPFRMKKSSAASSARQTCPS